MNNLLAYRYYDTPEGSDIFLKSVTTSKYAAIAGLAYGSYDVLMYSRTKGVLNSVARLGYIAGPLVGMACAFTVTSNVAVNVRGKNDKVNYFLGGIVAGAVFSAWQKKPIVAVPAMVALGIAGIVKKTAVDAGYQFFPPLPQMTKTAVSAKHDWTMSPDVDSLKTWTKG